MRKLNLTAKEKEARRLLKNKAALAYQKANPEKSAVRQQRWKKANPEKVKEINERWYKNHPGKAAKVSRKWRKNNPEKNTALNNAWLLAHPGYHLMASRKAQARARVIRPWYNLINNAEQRAKKQGMPYNLTETWAKTTWTGKCALTDIPFVFRKRGEKKGVSLFTASLDRIDSNKGYTKTNSRFILVCLNWCKNAGSDEEMIIAALALVKKAGYRVSKKRHG